MIAKLPDRNATLLDLLPFANIDVIVTDLDGTLITGNEDVSDRIKENINILRRKKVYITIATGRTFKGAYPLINQINIEIGMPICLYNGAIVLEYGTDTLLYSNLIDINIVYDFIEKVFSLDITIYIYTFSIDNIALLNEGESRVKEQVYGLGMKKNQKDVNNMPIQWLVRDEDIKKVREPIVALLIEKNGLKESEIEYIKKSLRDTQSLVYTDSGDGFIEAKMKGLNKGGIISTLKEKYKYKNILAIGDNDNDEELFQYADISVAVENSSTIAIDAADFICENESAYGFLDMLTVINNAKRYC